MKRILIVAAAAFLLVQALPRTASAFWGSSLSVMDVVDMHQDGIPDSLIITKIQHSGTVFKLGVKELHLLRAAGVSNDVVVAMLKTEDAQRVAESYAPHYVS